MGDRATQSPLADVDLLKGACSGRRECTVNLLSAGQQCGGRVQSCGHHRDLERRVTSTVKVFFSPVLILCSVHWLALQLQAELGQTVSLALLSESLLLHFPAPVALFCPRRPSSSPYLLVVVFPTLLGLLVGQGLYLRTELQALWTTTLGSSCSGFVWGLAVGLAPRPQCLLGPHILSHLMGISEDSLLGAGEPIPERPRHLSNPRRGW